MTTATAATFTFAKRTYTVTQESSIEQEAAQYPNFHQQYPHLVRGAAVGQRGAEVVFWRNINTGEVVNVQRLF